MGVSYVWRKVKRAWRDIDLMDPNSKFEGMKAELRHKLYVAGVKYPVAMMSDTNRNLLNFELTGYGLPEQGTVGWDADGRPTMEWPDSEER